MLTSSWNSFYNKPITYLSERSFSNLISSLPEDYVLFSLNGEAINSKSELLYRISNSMKFPDYFGHNWDALKDCLSDLSWIPAKGYIIWLTHMDSFIKNCPDDFKIFSEIIEMVAAFWAEQKIEFALIIEIKNELAG